MTSMISFGEVSRFLDSNNARSERVRMQNFDAMNYRSMVNIFWFGLDIGKCIFCFPVEYKMLKKQQYRSLLGKNNFFILELGTYWDCWSCYGFISQFLCSAGANWDFQQNFQEARIRFGMMFCYDVRFHSKTRKQNVKTTWISLF